MERRRRKGGATCLGGCRGNGLRLEPLLGWSSAEDSSLHCTAGIFGAGRHRGIDMVATLVLQGNILQM